jgi:hypothetical protein
LPEPKPKIGIFGGPGEGKSLLLSVISHLDFALPGDPIWSNIKMKYSWAVPYDISKTYGLKSGVAVFQAQRFDERKMYRMDPEYRGGCYALDEINVQIADALKFNTNANFYFNQVDQQLRKDRNGLVYTSIHEMWVDSRVREITDIMIKVFDTALSPEGISAQKPRGQNIEFWVYPMSRYLTGRTWVDHGEKLGPFYLHATRWLGMFDTYEKQATGQKYARGLKELLGEDANQPEYQVGDNEIAFQEYSKWGWLYKLITALHDDGVQEIATSDLWDLIGEDKLAYFDKGQIGTQLSKMGITKKGYTGNHYSPLRYIIEDFDVAKNPERKSAKAIDSR